jgi:hypothetical protein
MIVSYPQVPNGLSLKMGPIGRPEKSVRNYHSTRRKIPKEGSSHIHRGGSPKSRIELHIFAQHITKFEKKEITTKTRPFFMLM